MSIGARHSGTVVLNAHGIAIALYLFVTLWWDFEGLVWGTIPCTLIEQVIIREDIA